MKNNNSLINLIFDFFNFKKSGTCDSQQNSLTINAEDGSTIIINELIGGNKQTNVDDRDKLLKKFDIKSPDIYSGDHAPIDNKLSALDFKHKVDIEKAENCQRKWNFSEAINIYLDIITNSPSLNTTFVVYVNIAICYLNSQHAVDNLEKAKNYLLKAEQLNNSANLEKLYYAYAIYEFYNNNISSAIVNIDKSLEINHNYIRAINIKSLLREKSGEPISTILNDTYFNDQFILNNIFKHEQSSLKTIGQLCLKNNDTDNAISFLKEANNLNKEDIATLSFLGDAYLFKAIGDNSKEEHIFSKEKFVDITQSVKYYEQALDIGKVERIPVELSYFLINYSAALLFLGQHKEAYDKIQKALLYGISDDELFINKARLETILGNYQDALDSCKNISSENKFIETALIYITEGNYKNCITYIKSNLTNISIDTNTKIILKEILADALIDSNLLDESKEVLLDITKSKYESWRTHISWAKYYEKCLKTAQCIDHVNIALTLHNKHPNCVVEAINIYGRNERYELIIKLLNTVLENNECEQELYKTFVFVNIAKAQFYKHEYYSVIETYRKGVLYGVSKDAFNKLLIETYRDLGNFSYAKKYALLEYAKNPKDFHLLFSLGNFSIRTGSIEEGIRYLHDSLQEQDSINSLSSIFISLSQAYILLSDYKKALHYAQKAKDADLKIPSSNAHSYFMHTSIRCGDINTGVEYMIDYHNHYPKHNIVKSIPSLMRDSEGAETLDPEFIDFLKNQHIAFDNALNIYKQSKLPLFFLAKYFQQPLSSIYEWRNIYNININIGSGSPTAFNKEIDLCKDAHAITIDFLSLIILSRVGCLENFLLEFRIIYISHCTFDEILNSIIYVDNKLVNNLLYIIINSPKIKFFSKETSGNYINNEFVELFDNSIIDTVIYSVDNNLLQCIADFTTRELLNKQNINSVSPLAIINRIYESKKISIVEYSHIKSLLMMENHFFISFNEIDILNIASCDDFKLNDKCKIFFEYILTSEPDIESFVNVYLKFFILLFNKINNLDTLKNWIKLYISVFNKLYLNLIYDNLYFIHTRFLNLKHNNIDFISNLTQPEMAILRLVIIIEGIESMEIFRNDLIDFIGNNISQADLYILFHNEIVPFARKKVIEFKRKHNSGSIN